MKILIFPLLCLSLFSSTAYNTKDAKIKEVISSFLESDTTTRCGSQWNDFFTRGKPQTMDLENADTIKLRFTAISEKQFLDFKAQKTGTIYDFADLPAIDTTFRVKTKNRSYKFRGDFWREYRYGGFIPEVNSHIIITCKEICTDYLLDNETDEQMILPDFCYDSGILGILVASSGKEMLLYSSYYFSDDLAEYYPKSTIIILQIGEGKGWHRLQSPKICLITELLIEEVVWIDDNTIALKAYDYNEYKNRIYTYFRTSIKI